jgi:hypothetical protein
MKRIIILSIASMLSIASLLAAGGENDKAIAK